MTDNGRRSRTPPGAATIFDPYMLMNGPNKKISNRLALYLPPPFCRCRAYRPNSRRNGRAARRDSYPRPVYPARRRRQHVLPVRDQPSRRFVPFQRVLRYASRDLKEWTGPYPAFVPDEGFWGGNNFWAAECHAYRDKYYLFATIRGKADSLLWHGHIRGRHAERTLQGTQQRARHARRLELARRNAACGPTRTAMDGFLP